jgi:hypothetical protein
LAIAQLALVSIVHARWLGPIDEVIKEFLPPVDRFGVLLFMAQVMAIPMVQAV